jgi:Spy/CpxP family protein refolding chaperone
MKKCLAILALTLVASLPLAAQPAPGGPASGPPPAGGPGGPGPNPEQVLKEYLGLSDAQLLQLRTLTDVRNQAAQLVQQHVVEAQKALGTALNATTPDPSTVGSALLALNAVQKQFGDVQRAFQTGFDGILTADQKTKLQGLSALDASLQALGATKGIGL